MLLQTPVALLFTMVLGTFSSAAPVVLNSRPSVRDVWAPPITYPTVGIVWKTGSTVTVTWDKSSPPAEVTNPIGSLLLGFMNPDGSGGENLDIDNPLASGFKLTDGNVTFKVPQVQTKTNYIVALIGDSGNVSPQFTINNSYAK